MVEALQVKGCNISVLANTELAHAISSQIIDAISWIYANRKFRYYSPELPSGFDQIVSIAPFIYIPPRSEASEVYIEGNLLAHHAEIWENHGYMDQPLPCFSGFRISFNHFIGDALYFNVFNGLTEAEINNLWGKKNMLIYEHDKKIRIITPPTS